MLFHHVPIAPHEPFSTTLTSKFVSLNGFDKRSQSLWRLAGKKQKQIKNKYEVHNRLANEMWSLRHVAAQQVVSGVICNSAVDSRVDFGVVGVEMP